MSPRCVWLVVTAVFFPPASYAQTTGHRATASAATNELVIERAEPATEVNTLFTQADGWIGADGAYSVPLGSERTLWLFSDTWVGHVRDGRRVDATIVNNSIAVQQGRGADATVEFIVARDPDDQPRAWVEPDDGRGWFWLQAGAAVDSGVVLFLAHIERTDDPGVFGFRHFAQWLGVVDDSRVPPRDWSIRQLRLPNTVFTPERVLTFGSAVLRRGDYLFVYGTDEEFHDGGRSRHLVVARVPVGRVADFTAWEYFVDGTWKSDGQHPSRLVPDMASECSVTYLADRQQYLLIYSEWGLSPRILARVAPEPVGPWSEPVVVYECPEAAWDRQIFCYAAKAHESLVAGDQFILSYAANSFDFWQVARDARLYWPRFVRVDLEPQTGDADK
jgi:hypothetical protein